MNVFVVGLHITLCFFLILVVLLQPGKGADFGAAMGGSSASADVFGATGSVGLLTKLTAIVAMLFMGTSLSLAWMSGRALDMAIDTQDLIDEAREGADEGETATEAPAEETAPDGDAVPSEGDAGEVTPDGDEAPVEGDAGEVTPDGDEAPGEGDTGEVTPDGDEAPSEGDAGDTAAPDGEAPAEDAAPGDEASPGTEDEESGD
jgi:preprotein translocase subunit SecG